GGLTLELLVSAYTGARLGGLLDQEVTLHTQLYLEAQAQGATITPRLAGFLTADDRAFFQLFVSVKGIGNRKALRAMAMSTAQIAAAIADRDLATLRSLPEIGKRTAETIVVSLQDKVERFAATTAGGGTSAEPAPAAGARSGLEREAMEVLLQLGESRPQAMAWIEQAMAGEEPPADVEALIAEVYRLKSGG
ncbi:MAG: Holliday junction branch migration protein RuvA, partial [Phycisphaeraceae bacterium]